jgi:transcriptional regulator with XRE-family HTH domain
MVVLGAQGEPREKRQQLSSELRILRDSSGMSGRELAQQIGISQSKVSRIESGATIPTLPQVTAWADAVGASSETRERLVAMTEAVFTEVNSWRAALRTQTHLQDAIHEREAHARMVRNFQPSVVPGLLQTAEYARRALELFQAPYEGDVSAAVAGRLQRQAALFDEGRRFEFLITEAALRWRPGSPKLLPAQLHHIASLSTLGNVSIGLIPQSRQADSPALHGFVIYDGSDNQDSLVTIEAVHGSVTVHDPDDIGLYQHQWSLLQQMAIFHDEARAFLTDLADDIRTTTE